ncbi:MAG: ATP-dependent zinc metalloprotease FtsH [Corallococcus sp.]|nr:ATP-dependent zinc metalloprotease FtsH [Corallococcus sp.]MCM1359958.1 ATP-dependent zinc metalloprotease FtsH [Corallococcus sp.]MCM1395514.1 ATP-dependent zinc metalloprotease FtsH [Corallococcus sp.]
MAVFLLLWHFLSPSAEKITYDEFRKGITTYDKVYLNYYKVTAVKKQGDKSTTYSFVIVDRAEFNAFMNKVQDEGGITVGDEFKPLKEGFEFDTADPNATSWTDYIMPVLWIGLLILLGVLLFRQIAKQNNQNMDFGCSRAKAVQNIKVRFSDVAGAEEEKEELQEIIDFLKDPKRFHDMGARVPKGVLLVGPPGTGKTLFAKAVAGEAGVPFFSMSGSDFVEMFVGVGASRVRDLFDQAKKNMPCIIFIDEIDAVGRQRGAGLGGGHDEREQTLNQLLVEMDGFETNTSIIIMAATNRADILDPALLRPGRFDRQIYVNRPDVRGREAILKVHARKKPIGPDVNFRTVARITAGFTGADLENLLNEAAILAVREGRKVITMADVNEGINKVVMGPQKKSRLVTEPDKRITAYHESGHAILASCLKYCDPVHEVTIIPRGMAAGYTMTRPENDNNHVTKQQLLDEITMTLGGRVAEELIIKNISSGASGDIKSLTERAHRMVTEWGMSDRIGPLFYGSDGEIFVGRSYQQEKGYSDEVANIIDEEVREIVESCHKRATELLTQNMQVLHNMARVLIEKETIHTDEVHMLMDGKSADDVIAFMEQNESKTDAKITESTESNVAEAETAAPGGDAVESDAAKENADGNAVEKPKKSKKTSKKDDDKKE